MSLYYFVFEDDDVIDGCFFIYFDNVIWLVRVESFEVLFVFFDD